MEKRLLIRLDKIMHDSFKIKCITENTSMTKIIKKAIDKYLSNEEVATSDRNPWEEAVREHQGSEEFTQDLFGEEDDFTNG